MNDLNHLQSSVAHGTASENKVTEQLRNSGQLPDTLRISSLNESFRNTVAGNILQSPENFSLSNYEDDDDDSGFSCPCCLPR